MNQKTTPPPTATQPLVSEHASLLRLVANSVPALMAFYDSDTFRCLFANSAYARTFGFNEQTILGRTLEEIIGDEAARAIEPHITELRLHHRSARYERQLDTAQGPRWLDVQLLPHLASDGVLDGAFVLINDVTPRREAELALRQSEERLSKFMDASVEGIVFHENGIITDANLPLQRLVGYGLDELLGRKTLDFIAPDQVPRAMAMVAQRAELSYESALLHRDGSRIPVEFIVRMAERGGQSLRMVIVRDLRAALAQRAHIQHLAHHDPLTNLLNRHAFMERLAEHMAGSRSREQQGALLFIDLDHFKRVNDSLGHVAGDLLLQTLAQRLTTQLRSSDLVARFGGDEFVALLPGALQPSQVEDVAAKLLAALAEPVLLEGRPISVTPSVGIALYPQHAANAADLVKHADAAMYEAKRHGRATHRWYDPLFSQRALAALELETQLTQAIARGEFVLHYQPQVRAADGETRRLRGADPLAASDARPGRARPFHSAGRGVAADRADRHLGARRGGARCQALAAGRARVAGEREPVVAATARAGLCRHGAAGARRGRPARPPARSGDHRAHADGRCRRGLRHAGAPACDGCACGDR